MPLNVDALEHWRFEDNVQTYTDRDTMLYALGVGFGADPMDEAELRFVYEQALVAMPTMVVVLGSSGTLANDPRSGITQNMVVHGEQRLSIQGPLPHSGTVRSKSRVIGVEDKGAGKGALVHVERALFNEADGAPIATLINTTFARADGGFGRSFGLRLQQHTVPSRVPDVIVDCPTSPSQALLYRLNNDRNPLHSDPAFARSAGFPRPILHGLGTYGIAARALLSKLLHYDVARLRSFDTRFSAVVYPGETISIEFWRDAETVSFRAWVRERNARVLDNGRALISN
jgi:acyl dehydratase